MNRKLSLLISYIVLGISLSMANIALAAAAANNATVTENRLIPYPSSYIITSSGAAAYRGIGNVADSPYYLAPDFFSMTSTSSLTLLPRYKTYQQTTEITCGPAAALTVLYHFGDTTWEEYKIANIMGTKPKIGTDTSGMVKFFQSIGWVVQSSLTATGKDDASFTSVNQFKDFVIANLRRNTPIMVENID